ncbi:hypothetical protein NYE69_17005 [Paenibacillus sp. FSL R5-0527]|nr:hypothetical protein [Paenibacillus macerans]
MNGGRISGQPLPGQPLPGRSAEVARKSPARNVSGNATFFLPRDVLY